MQSHADPHHTIISVLGGWPTQVMPLMVKALWSRTLQKRLRHVPLGCMFVADLGLQAIFLL